MTAPAARMGRPTKAENEAMDLAARKAEAFVFVDALRTIAREFLAVAIEAGPAAYHVTRRLEIAVDKYEHRWVAES